MTSYSPEKDSLLKRLTRVEGQIRGINRMVAGDTYCIDVITQISAAQAALDKIALELLRSHATQCMATEISEEKRSERAEELVQTMRRLLAR